MPNSIPSAGTGDRVEDGDIFISQSKNIVSWSLPTQELMSVGRVIAPAGDGCMWRGSGHRKSGVY